MDAAKIDARIAALANQRVKEREYWLHKLSGEGEKSMFPYDYPETGPLPRDDESGHVDTMNFRLDGELGSRLMALCRGNDFGLHTILCAALAALLYKYSDSRDIALGTPIYRQSGEKQFLNTVLLLRILLPGEVTFKQLLQRVKQEIGEASENQNYPLELLKERLRTDVAVVLTNIQRVEHIRHIPCRTIFSFSRQDTRVDANLEYDNRRFEGATIGRIVAHFKSLLQAAVFAVDVPLDDIDLLGDEERRQILADFNDTAQPAAPPAQTVHNWFENQADRTPDSLAVRSSLDFSDVYRLLAADKVEPDLYEAVEGCCFEGSAYVFRAALPLPGGGGHLNILKTHRHNSVLANGNTQKLIDLLDGRRSVESIYLALKGLPVEFLVYSPKSDDLLEITFEFNRQPEVFGVQRFGEFVGLLRCLYRNHLIELVGRDDGRRDLDFNTPLEAYFETDESLDRYRRLVPHDVLNRREGLAKADVLLLGDTPGMPSTGLLYLGAYLMRKGIRCCCQFYDPAADYRATRENIETLLRQVQPQLVGVSMKWFLYMARVLDMCKIIKDVCPDSKIVLGGNTAAYYWQEVMGCGAVDYVVRGDGELPLLKICLGEREETIPNLCYRREGEITANPVTYVQDERDASDIYLSHLDELLLSRHASIMGTFYINTHKGCLMNCLYCGGCRTVQQKTFNRDRVWRRGITGVRKDIEAALTFASAFQFDFDVPADDLSDYCRDIWRGIDLSAHFCLFSSLIPPSSELIELVCRTFKYVYFDLDITSLSEKHRKRLFSLGLVKSQPSDQAILAFLDNCQKFENVEVRINLITGLPYFTPGDIEISERLLSLIMNAYTCFSELHWARLHAQPGAPLVQDPAKHHMHAFATTFKDFLEYSEKNFDRQAPYPQMEFFQYPYIYFEDEKLNSRVSRFHQQNHLKVQQHRQARRQERFILEGLSYRDLNTGANRLARLLRRRGVTANTIIPLLLEPSFKIILGIMGILKAGAGYLPIDPGYPDMRIRYMLQDSLSEILITQKKFLHRFDFDGEILDIDDAAVFTEDGANLSNLNEPADIVYTIYTSGTSGRAKGVLVQHANLVNYVNWFSRAVGLSGRDRALLTSSFAFDLGNTAVYPPLLQGGECHVLPKEIYLTPHMMLAYIKEMAISCIKMTPSLLSTLVNSPDFSAQMWDSLRLAVVGGEPINVRDIARIRDMCPGVRVMNHYGPTEATIGSVARLIDFERFGEFVNRPTIGTPIGSSWVVILDRQRRLRPVGLPGELCIGGFCLARGYLNNPELTADKFITAPVTSSSTSHRTPTPKSQILNPKSHILTPKSHPLLYRTGDLARFLENGDIEFLGRLDNQVKIRGYRIELAEIESQLLHHPGIEEAVAAVRPGAGDDPYLCAYLVPRKSEDGDRKRGKRLKNHGEFRFADIEIEGHALKLEGEEAEPGRQTVVQLVERKAEVDPDEVALTSAPEGLTYGRLNRRANRLARLILENYDDRFRLSKGEKTRYHRQMLLHGWGVASQEKLKGTTVFVAGAGGGASPTLTQLALAGFGTIIVCDYDEVEPSNLNRQFLHDDSRIGMNKALSAQKTINRINPHVKVIAISRKLTRENVFDLVGDSAIIFDMLDDLESKFILAECAVAREIPQVVAAMMELNAYAVLFHAPHTPCFYCIFDERKYRSLLEGMRQVADDYRKKPLHVVASSLFVGTGFAVTEAIKVVLGFENPAYNRFFLFNHRASREVVNLEGYQMMTYPFSDHFRRLSKAQGFDWDEGFRGRFLEELTISPDPLCPLCGEKGRERRLSLAKRMSPQNIMGERISIPADEAEQAVGLLLSKEADVAVGVLGVLKSGKICVPLAPASAKEKLIGILEDAEIRLIVTDPDHIDLAVEIRDRVNRNIAVIDMGNLAEDIDPANLDLPITLQQTAAILYPSPTEGVLRVPELKAYLQGRLPDYMVPAFFVQLAEMPLTANGKIDRRALPEPRADVSAGAKIGPRDEIEEKLAAIWSGILEIEKDGISMDANFFELGGHSLKVTVMVGKIKRELGVTLPVGEAFKAATIGELAAYIRTEREHLGADLPGINQMNDGGSEDRLLLLKKGAHGNRDHLFFIHDGSGEAGGYSEFCHHLKTTLNCWGIEADRALGQAPRNVKISRIAAEYIGRLKRVRPHGPYRLVGWSLGGTIAFEMARQLEQAGQKIDFLALIDTTPPAEDLRARGIEFDLETELSTLDSYFQDRRLKTRLAKVEDIDRVWPEVLAHLREIEFQVADIRDSVSHMFARTLPDFGRTIPHFDRLGIEAFIYHLNMLRTLDNARNKYVPEGKISTVIHLFLAAGTGFSTPEKWQNYCREPLKLYDIAGDHFSIFRNPRVAAFARLFERVMEKNVGQR
jgi:amino acid adenylation domain-containing protein